jgi:hypothetical protein
MRGKIPALVASALALAGAVVWAAKPDLALFSVGTGDSGAAQLSFSTREEFKPNGFIRIMVLQDGTWQEAGRVQEDEHLRGRTVDLSSWRSSGDLVVRLEPVVPGASHLDTVTVDGKTPKGLDERLSRKLLSADNDIVDFAEIAGRDLVFAPGRQARLSITARAEPAVIGTDPAAYPAANVYRPVSAFQSFYRYRLGSRSWTPSIDGSLRNETLGKPLFSVNQPIGSGHPESPTWAWVGDDGTNLYALIDFTADNTLDGGKDYARMHVRTADGIRTFGVTAESERWGKAGFEYTDRVGWEHKVYEIAVPLSELGAVTGSDLDLAFTLYGTAATSISFATDPNGVDPDFAPSGSTFTFTVKYSNSSGAAPQRHDLWIDVNQNGLPDAAAPFVLPWSGAGPWLAGAAVLAGLACLVAVRRRTLARLLAVAIAAFALTTCKLPTTQEIYPMSSSGTDWMLGVVFTADVELVADPGDYVFEFLFEDNFGTPVMAGSAAGPHAVVIE